MNTPPSDLSIPGLIDKKKEGQALSEKEIEDFVRYVKEVEINKDAGSAADLQKQEDQIGLLFLFL